MNSVFLFGGKIPSTTLKDGMLNIPFWLSVGLVCTARHDAPFEECAVGISVDTKVKLMTAVKAKEEGLLCRERLLYAGW